MNSITVIAPSRLHGMWVFDDPARGLVQEPFVGGADTMIDRIVAAADAERTAAPGNVVSITAGRRASAPVAQRRPPVHQRSSWQAAALLAASLFVGAFVGTSGLLNQAIPSFGEVDVAEADVTELVIDGNRSSLIEEDLL